MVNQAQDNIMEQVNVLREALVEVRKQVLSAETGDMSGLQGLKDLQAMSAAHEKQIDEVTREFKQCKEVLKKHENSKAGAWYSVKGFGFDMFGVSADADKDAVIGMIKIACGLRVGADITVSNVWRWRHRAGAKKVNWSFTVHNDTYIPRLNYKFYPNKHESEPRVFIAPSLTEEEDARKKSLKGVADFLATTHFLRWRRDVLYVLPKAAAEQQKSSWIKVDVISPTLVKVSGVSYDVSTQAAEDAVPVQAALSPK